MRNSRTPLRHERLINGVAVKTFRGALPQDQLATLAGPNPKGQPMSVGTVSRIEAGTLQPSLDIMCRLANALGVPLDAISYIAAVYVPDEATRPRGVVCDADGTAA